MNFANEIINWYRQNKRELPWRNTRNAYHIWLSEIILQQTRVAQGMSYYKSFVSTYPTVKELALAKEDEVLKLWQGLGYYSRARNLHFTAKEIVKKHNAKFPQHYDEIRSLKGIGDYTAAAIASFAFDKAHAVVDGNVYRVLARMFAIHTPIDSVKGKKEFAALADELLLRKKPAEYNQAIMEFGAIQCVPKNPACTACCLNSMCMAYAKKEVDLLPIKAKKTKQRQRYFDYFIIEQGAYTYIKQRGAGDIWQGLYEFPLIESSNQISEKNLMQSAEWKAMFGKEKLHIKSISAFHKHILSHQILQARFWEMDGNTAKLKLDNTFIKIKKTDLANFAWPRLIDRYLTS